MTRQRLAYLLLAAFAVACTDQEPKRAAPTEAPPPPVASVAAPQVVAGQASTVCLVQVRKRDAARLQLKNDPSDPKLQARVKALDALVADACN